MTEQTPQENAETLDLGALTDEEIQSMSPAQVEKYLAGALTEEADGDVDSADDSSESVEDQTDDQSAAADGDEATEPDVTGGADSGYQTLDPYGEVADSGSADPSQGAGNEEASVDEGDPSGEDGQSEQAGAGSEAEDDSTGEHDWKAEYEALKAQYDQVLGSFKASGRTIKVESPDDARRLMQMGYDYNIKMRELKPRLRAIRALEQNGLLDDEKFNFMIDLMKGNAEAVKKFLKDSEIDPIELDLEDSTEYRPTDHRPSDEQLALDEVLDSIRGTQSFPRTAQVITKEWDKASQDVLMGIPQIIAVINDHMEKGYYDKIADKVAYERSLGRLAGLSDLDAYKTVGDAMEARGEFTPAGAPPAQTEQSGQGPSQDLQGSSGSTRDRKRAASPTKGNASAGKRATKNFLRDFTDEEIEAMSL